MPCVLDASRKPLIFSTHAGAFSSHACQHLSRHGRPNQACLSPHVFCCFKECHMRAKRSPWTQPKNFSPPATGNIANIQIWPLYLLFRWSYACSIYSLEDKHTSIFYQNTHLNFVWKLYPQPA
jgi:hypothetical protein